MQVGGFEGDFHCTTMAVTGVRLVVFGDIEGVQGICCNIKRFIWLTECESINPGIY